ncbi:ester cyclase [Alloyangia pacifica]|uniref:ester cyclase n=1 Tax=Alloyangia pacifica TaxID=311180 RepID=UPI001CD1EE7E|nr:ester cyclase [Alloyangia pacifica]MCA0994127.1 ester cyclase [Alloyangia pacifica]
MQGFDQQFRDFPDYLRKLAAGVWTRRSLDLGAAGASESDAGNERGLAAHWHPQVILRRPQGIGFGPEALRAEVLELASALPDLSVQTEDVLCSGAPKSGLLGAQRLLFSATHAGEGVFGTPSGRRLRFRALAELHAKDNRVADLWAVRDTGALLRQLGLSVRDWARFRIAGHDPETQPFRPEVDVQGPYSARGNDNHWGQGFAALLAQMMDGGFSGAAAQYDPAARLDCPGGQALRGPQGAERFWLGLRASFPSARFELHHCLGEEVALMPPRAALRWSLTGRHEGWGAFGRPTGARVHVMGLSQAEFGPGGLRREWSLYDEAAVWMQIHLATGHAEARQPGLALAG